MTFVSLKTRRSPGARRVSRSLKARCSGGAAGLAREGKSYREILAHYYPGTDVVKMY